MRTSPPYTTALLVQPDVCPPGRCLRGAATSICTDGMTHALSPTSMRSPAGTISLRMRTGAAYLVHEHHIPPTHAAVSPDAISAKHRPADPAKCSAPPPGEDAHVPPRTPTAYNAACACTDYPEAPPVGAHTPQIRSSHLLLSTSRPAHLSRALQLQSSRLPRDTRRHYGSRAWHASGKECAHETSPQLPASTAHALTPLADALASRTAAIAHHRAQSTCPPYTIAAPCFVSGQCYSIRVPPPCSGTTRTKFVLEIYSESIQHLGFALSREDDAVRVPVTRRLASGSVKAMKRRIGKSTRVEGDGGRAKEAGWRGRQDYRGKRDSADDANAAQEALNGKPCACKERRQCDRIGKPRYRKTASVREVLIHGSGHAASGHRVPQCKNRGQSKKERKETNKTRTPSESIQSSLQHGPQSAVAIEGLVGQHTKAAMSRESRRPRKDLVLQAQFLPDWIVLVLAWALHEDQEERGEVEDDGTSLRCRHCAYGWGTAARCVCGCRRRERRWMWRCGIATRHLLPNHHVRVRTSLLYSPKPNDVRIPVDDRSLFAVALRVRDLCTPSSSLPSPQRDPRSSGLDSETPTRPSLTDEVRQERKNGEEQARFAETRCATERNRFTHVMKLHGVPQSFRLELVDRNPPVSTHRGSLATDNYTKRASQSLIRASAPTIVKFLALYSYTRHSPPAGFKPHPRERTRKLLDWF
ncbi:hypothetical protein DFH06DRAFT_1305966 [Mycena polygramma]|nr:hypothetical protein DFH06DRAFT_1305966 [Mycena polygramma]